MEDFGEYTPLDAVAHDGSTGTALHNRYAALFHATADAVTRRLEQLAGRRLARFARSGWTGSASVTPIVWGGDPTTSWGFDRPGQRGYGGALPGCQRGGHVGERRRRLLRRWTSSRPSC